MLVVSVVWLRLWLWIYGRIAEVGSLVVVTDWLSIVALLRSGLRGLLRCSGWVSWPTR